VAPSAQNGFVLTCSDGPLSPPSTPLASPSASGPLEAHPQSATGNHREALHMAPGDASAAAAAAAAAGSALLASGLWVPGLSRLGVGVPQEMRKHDHDSRSGVPKHSPGRTRSSRTYPPSSTRQLLEHYLPGAFTAQTNGHSTSQAGHALANGHNTSPADPDLALRPPSLLGALLSER